VREGVVGEGGAVLCSFIDWFLLLLVACLLACLVSLSCLVSRVRASYLHLFGLSSLELGASFVVVSEREIEVEERWETMLLIVMLESSSRLAPSIEAMLMACSRTQWAWCSTIIEVSCSL